MKIVSMVDHPFPVEREKLNGMLQSLASSLRSRKAKMIGDTEDWVQKAGFAATLTTVNGAGALCAMLAQWHDGVG